jgi:hypothetical protein
VCVRVLYCVVLGSVFLKFVFFIYVILLWPHLSTFLSVATTTTTHTQQYSQALIGRFGLHHHIGEVQPSCLTSWRVVVVMYSLADGLADGLAVGCAVLADGLVAVGRWLIRVDCWKSIADAAGHSYCSCEYCVLCVYIL